MRKFLIASAVASVIWLGGQYAWADEGQNHQTDYKVFKKVVRVLNDVINDDCHRHTREVSHRHGRPVKVCHVRHHRGHYKKICRVYR